MKNTSSKQYEILLVDDKPENLKVLIHFLEEEDYKILIATSGERALSQIARRKPDLILLDILMPNVDGFETCRLIKDIPDFVDIPIIFITALSDTESKTKAFSAGGVDYICKPFLQEEVLARIETHLTIYAQKKTLRGKNKQLVKSQANLTALVENTGDMIWSIDRNYKLTVANSVFVEYVKPFYQGVINIGMLLIDEKTLSPEILQEWKAIYDRVLSGERFSMEIPGIISENDGYLEISYNPIYEGKKIVGASAFGREITNRKKSEQELIEIKEELSSTQKIAKIGSWELNLNTQIITLSSEFLILIDEKPQRVSMPLIEYVKKHVVSEDVVLIQDRFESAVKNIKNKDYTDNFEYRIKTNDGTIKHFAIKGNFKTTGIVLGVTQDITEQKAKEEKIKKLSLAVEQSANTVVITDTGGNVEYVNPKFSELTGYSAEEILGKNIKILRSGKQSDEYYAHMWQTITSGETWRGEFYNKRKNGSFFWEKVTITPIKNDAGETINFLAIKEDISANKKAESELLKAEEKAEESRAVIKEQARLLDLIFSHSLDNIVILDKDYNFIKVSDTYAKAVQKEIAELIGKNHFDLYPSNFKEEADKVKKNKTAYLRQARPFVYQDHPEWGTTYWDLGLVPILDEKNAVELFLLTLKDVSKEIISKQEAKESEERFKAISEQATEGITVATMEGDYVLVNPAFCKMSGYSEEELMDLKVFDMKAENQPQQSFYDSIEKMKGIPIRVNLQRKDGTEYLTEIIGTVISLNNKQFVLGTVRDITERVKAENDLIKAKEKAEESDRLKSAFLANVSHEIRTPMNGILGFSSLLKEANLSGNQQKKYIEIIERSGYRMLNTINDIVDISKIEAEQVHVSISKININEHMEHLYAFFKLEAEKKGIQLSCEKGLPTQEATIESDKDKIDSILTNLIKNALKYSHEGHIEFGYTLKNVQKLTMLEFYVKDTGIGIPKNRQKAIFDRFVQADIGDTRVYEGSGLGLSISKAYVEMLGGEIRVESRDGVGSQFYFTIPCSLLKKETEPNKIEAVVKTKPSIKKIKMLIVDDEETAGLYLTIALKKFKREILQAKTGLEALELCRENPDLDLILMDVRMPEMDGYEATRKIRKFNTDVIIIAQTAFAQTGEREQALQAGCNDYISKPISKEKLHNMIYDFFAE